MNKIKKKEMIIKQDIINEMDIPNVLDKVRPIAKAQADEFLQENRTVKLNFHRPAKIFATCFAAIIGVFLIVFVGVNLTHNSKASFDIRDNASSENGMSYEQNSTPKQSDAQTSSFEDYQGEHQEEPSSGISDSDMEKYYNEVSTYLNEGKTLEEILAIYQARGDFQDEDIIKSIYNYLNN